MRSRDSKGRFIKKNSEKAEKNRKKEADVEITKVDTFKNPIIYINMFNICMYGILRAHN